MKTNSFAIYTIQWLLCTKRCWFHVVFHAGWLLGTTASATYSISLIVPGLLAAHNDLLCYLDIRSTARTANIPVLANMLLNPSPYLIFSPLLFSCLPLCLHCKTAGPDGKITTSCKNVKLNFWLFSVSFDIVAFFLGPRRPLRVPMMPVRPRQKFQPMEIHYKYTSSFSYSSLLFCHCNPH